MEQPTVLPKTRLVFTRSQLLWGGFAIVVVGIIGVFSLVLAKPSPLEAIKRQFGVDYTQYPSKEFPTRAINSYVESGVTSIAFTESICSGVSCGSILCFDVYANGRVSQSGQDSGPVIGYSAPPQYDFVTCTISNKMISEEPPIEPTIEIPPMSTVITESPSERYLLRYDYTPAGNAELFLVTPVKAIELSEITDPNIRAEQVVWAESAGKVFINSVDYANDSGPMTQLTSLNIANGRVVSAVAIPNGFYGAAQDFAFPLTLSPDEQKIAVQSDFYRTFRIYDLSLNLKQTVNTQWVSVEPFSDAMYQIPGYSMELYYEWKTNTAIEYQFQDEGAKVYTVTVN